MRTPASVGVVLGPSVVTVAPIPAVSTRSSVTIVATGASPSVTGTSPMSWKSYAMPIGIAGGAYAASRRS